MGLNDLEEAYKIELDVNHSPWKYETFLSSFEVGHKGLICRNDNQMIGFIIFSPITPEAHILSISVRSNVKAINFYEKFGFSKDAIRNNYYTDNSEDALLMSLSI